MDYINQRLTESQKRANKFKEARDIVDYLIPAYHSSENWIEEYDRDLANYRIINNQLQKDDFEAICNPLGLKEGYFEDEILPYNKIPSKLNLLLGEELKRNEDYSAMLLDDSSILMKDYQMSEMFYQYAIEEIEKVEKEIRLKSEGKTEEEIQRELEKYSSNFNLEDLLKYKTELEIFANAVIKYASHACDLKTKKNTGFKHAMITDKEVIYVGMKNGKPDIEPVNILHFFSQKGPEVENYEDGDWAGRRMLMTLNEVSRRYGNLMTKKEYNELATDSHSKRETPYHEKNSQVFPDYYKSAFGEHFSHYWNNYDDHVGQYGDSSGRTHFEEDLVWVTHLTWKWERKIGFLTIYDQFGESDTMIVDSEYKARPGYETVEFTNSFGYSSKKKVWFDDFGLKHELEEMWIPRVWEATRIGTDVYVNIREVPFQPISITNPFEAKLPYIGKIYSAMNADQVSPVARMKPFNILYMVVMHQFVKLIARNYGAVIQIDTSQIDPNLGDGDPQLALERTLIYLREGISIFNSLKDAESGRDVNINRSATNLVPYSNTADIVNLTQILAWLDREIGMGFGISPEREGVYQPYSNVTDNQQGLVQSSNITEVYFYKHNQIWKSVLDYYVNMFRRWAKSQFDRDSEMSQINLRYILPNGAPFVFKITPDMVKNGDLGIYIANYGAGEGYYREMANLALTFVQNDRASLQDISMLLKSRLDGTSPEEVHKMIVDLEKKKQDKEERIQQAQQQSQADAVQLQKDMEQLKHEHRIVEIKLEKGLEAEIKAQEVTQKENTN